MVNHQPIILKLVVLGVFWQTQKTTKPPILESLPYTRRLQNVSEASHLVQVVEKHPSQHPDEAVCFSIFENRDIVVFRVFCRDG